MIFTALFVWLVFVIPFSISAIELTFPALLVSWLFAFRWPFSRASRSLLSGEERKTLLALAVYVALCTASLFYSHFIETTTRGLVGKLYEYAALFAMALFAARSHAVSERCARALRWATWLVVLHALLQEWTILRTTYTTDHDPILGHLLAYNRMVGPYKNPNDLATYFMVSGLLLISRMFGRSDRFSAGSLLLLALVLGCLIWIQSMGALLGLLTGIGVLVLLNWKDKRQVAALTVTAVLMVVPFLYLGRSSLREILHLADIVSKERGTMWSVACEMIRAKPTLGVGYNTFMANYGQYVSDRTLWPAYAHNCYLQIAAETGLIGLASFMAFLCYFLKTVLRAVRIAGDAFLAGLLAGLIAFLVQSAFDTNLYALRQAVLFWTLSGLAAGLSGSILKKTKPCGS